MVNARSENNTIRVGVVANNKKTTVSASSNNVNNEVSASNNKAKIYEEMALEHSNTAKNHAEQSRKSAERSEESAIDSENALNEILANENLKKVAENEENINKVATNVQNVNFVGENIEDITELVTSLENLGDTTNINIVASNIDNINSLAEDIQTVEVNKNIVLSQVAVAVEQANKSTENATISTEQAEISTNQANISTQKALESKTFSENALIYSTNAKTSENNAREYSENALSQSTIATTQANISITQANNSLNYSKNAKTSEENALIYSNNAKLNADTSLENANISEVNSINAEIWAEGTDEEVQALGGVHSAKTWADLLSNIPDTSNFATKEELATKQDKGNYLTPQSLISYPTFGDLNNELGNYVTSEQAEVVLQTKQDKLTAGANISIVGNVISATSSGGGTVNAQWGQIIGGIENQEDLMRYINTLDGAIGDNASAINDNSEAIDSVASELQEVNNKIPTKISQMENDSNYITSSSLALKLTLKQDKLKAGENITIENNVISAKSGGLPMGYQYTLYCTDSYIPDGSLPRNGTEYSFSQFGSFANYYLLNGLLETCTYSEYENEIATYGFCNKFGIDTDNGTFKVPTAKQVERYLIKKKDATESDVTWYRIYSDGWCEQGGDIPHSGSSTTVYYTIPFKDLSYTFTAVNYMPSSNDTGGVATSSQFSNKTVSSIYISQTGDKSCSYHAEGYIDISAYETPHHFVVIANGSYNESQMNWGEWASGLNSKVDKDLANCTRPYIVEMSDKSLLPSWYVKYSNGWCEQGGYIPAKTTEFSYLFPFVSTEYFLIVNFAESSGTANSVIKNVAPFKTNSGFTIGSSDHLRVWEAKGYIE